MAQVTLSPEARRDLVSIRTYIRDELCNSAASQRIIAALKKKCNLAVVLSRTWAVAGRADSSSHRIPVSDL